MEKITKENKGITLVNLIITIIIMTILVSVSTYSGIDTYKSSKIKKFVTQMQLIQSKVGELVEENTIEEINNLGLEEITTSEQENIINIAYENQEITSNVINEYKVLTKTDILNLLDIEDVENSIMINFKTREVVSTKGIEYNGVTYYTQYKLPEGQAVIQNTNQVDRELSFNIKFIIEGINAKATIDDIKLTNGTLYYREENDNIWTVITNYTKAGEEYNVLLSKSGIYEFMIQDNISKKSSNIKENEMIEIVPDEYRKILVLINSPKTNQPTTAFDYSRDSDEWAYVEYNEKRYVWIPRFAYKTNVETNEIQIKFIKGNSTIATDNTYIDDTWTIHNKFKSNGVELTGVWVNMEVQQDLDMLIVLNSDYEIMTEINL